MALPWSDSSAFYCAIVKLECQTGQAYSRTRRITHWPTEAQQVISSSASTFQLLKEDSLDAPCLLKMWLSGLHISSMPYAPLIGQSSLFHTASSMVCLSDAFPSFSQGIQSSLSQVCYYIEILLELNLHHWTPFRFSQVLTFCTILFMFVKIVYCQPEWEIEEISTQ